MKSVSVIIPVYNTKDYLEEAIDSAIQQKDFLLELIIVDDGSTDGSSKIIDEKYGNLEIVKIFHIENSGQGNARNLGIKKASGEYLYFFDSDDILEQGLFKEFTEIAESSPNLDLFCFSGESFLDKGLSENEVTNQKLLSKRAYKRNISSKFEYGEEAFSALLSKKGFFAGPPFYICSKNLLEKNKICFRVGKYEDEDFTHTLFLHASKTYVTNKVFYKRRVRLGSTMQVTRNFEHLYGYIQVVEKLKKLKNLQTLKSSTKVILERRAEKFSSEVIIMKTLNNIKFIGNQKKVYRKFFFNNIFNNTSLLIFSIKYPILAKLKKIKKLILRQVNLSIY